MTRMLRSVFLNRSILLQLGAALILCQLLAHALTLALMFWRYERPDLLNATSVSTVQALGMYAVIDKTPEADRAALVLSIERAFPSVRIIPDLSLRDVITQPERRSAMFDGLAKASPDIAAKAVLVRLPQATDRGDRIAIRLEDQRYFEFDPESADKRITFPRIVATLFIAMVMVPLAVLAIWALAMLMAPLRRLARSADRFAIDLDPTRLPETGPAEIRQLAQAFNTMRERIRQLVDSRSRMLAAVSHDLRTPLTRIRLRIEALPDGEEKERTLRDIGMMNTMIGHVLSYLRDQASPSARERVDLATLLNSICDDFSDTGHAAHFSGPRNVVLECEPDLLTRAFSNIIDNAIKFGGKAQVSLEARSASEIIVRVEDNGPGIPDDRKAIAFEPFSRGDSARGTLEHEGFGLGLAIAKQIVERHGGQITLHDRAPSGLCVQIALPVRPGADTEITDFIRDGRQMASPVAKNAA
jgi:signal transduction histidine kinase